MHSEAEKKYLDNPMSMYSWSLHYSCTKKGDLAKKQSTIKGLVGDPSHEDEVGRGLMDSSATGSDI